MSKNTVSETADSNSQAVQEMAASLQEYWLLTVEWVRGNLLELSIATAAAVLLFFALSWLRRFAARIARKSQYRSAMKSRNSVARSKAESDQRTR